MGYIKYMYVIYCNSFTMFYKSLDKLSRGAAWV